MNTVVVWWASIVRNRRCFIPSVAKEGQYCTASSHATPIVPKRPVTIRDDIAIEGDTITAKSSTDLTADLTIVVDL